MQTPISNVLSLPAYIRSKSPSEAYSVSPDTEVAAQPKTPAPRRYRAPRTPSAGKGGADEIVERLALGDLDAATTLRERYIDRLRRAATGILGDEAEVARVVEFALEEACSGWPPERGRGRVDRWLLSLVRRAAIARKRVLGGLDSSHAPVRRRLSHQHVPTPRH